MYYEPFDPVRPHHSPQHLSFPAAGANQGLLDVFDCPDPASAARRRNVTTTPLQALALWNGSFALRMADTLAADLARDGDADPVAGAYQRILLRAPTAPERERAGKLVADHGLRALCRACSTRMSF